MKISLALLGLVAAQSGDYADSDRLDYDYDSYGNKKNKGNKNKVPENTQSYTFSNFGGRTDVAGHDAAVALSCWNTNEYRNAGSDHEAGKDQKDGGNFRSGEANRPHDRVATDGGWSLELDDQAMSLRHGGCLYEVAEYVYGANSFNKIRYLDYTPGGTEVVHWIHVFNGHVHISPVHDTVGNGLTGRTQNRESERAAVVIANPTFEGLGFLNFVATYRGNQANLESESPKYSDFGDWKLFINGDVYTTIHDDVGGNSGGDHWTWGSKFHSGHDLDAGWKSTGSSAPFNVEMDKGFSISSFPGNELGKDFRFNIRTLHNMGKGSHAAVAQAAATANDWSYYFYGVTDITITFPKPVARVNECYKLGFDADSCNDEHVADHIVDQYAVDISSVSSSGHTNGDNTIDKGNVPLITTTGTPVTGVEKADWCDNLDEGCFKSLKIANIANTYDEKHLRQYGTIQEIWVQLMYAIVHDSAGDGSAEFYQSPMNNLFFNANEVLSIVATAGGTTNERVPMNGANGTVWWSTDQ